jgi:hypothetical protein
MRERAFTLRTARFNSTESKSNFVNERCFGEDFAAWLASCLRTSGLEVSEPIQEDWGWCLVAMTQGKKFTVSLGIMDESIGQALAEWRIGVAYERSMNGFMSIFKPVSTAVLDSVGATLHAVLAAESTFSDLRSEA